MRVAKVHSTATFPTPSSFFNSYKTRATAAVELPPPPTANFQIEGNCNCVFSQRTLSHTTMQNRKENNQTVEMK